MNKQRRKDIESAIEHLELAKGIIDNASMEEQEYYDNMPESIQSSEKGDNAQEAVDSLDEASSDIDSIIDNLNEIVS